MTKFELKIESDNDAFTGNRSEEVARILFDVADRLVSDGALYGHLRDVNGNTVGHFEFIEEVD